MDCAVYAIIFAMNRTARRLIKTTDNVALSDIRSLYRESPANPDEICQQTGISETRPPSSRFLKRFS